MNARQLRDWKEREESAAKVFRKKLRMPPDIATIRDFYPEYEVCEDFSTSLEPTMPVWASLPFFSRVLVSVLPNIPSEDAFIRLYGLSVANLLNLADQGRIAIRLQFPHTVSTIPTYLNDVFSRPFPTTLRVRQFIAFKLGDDRIDQIKREFRAMAKQQPPKTTLDGSPAPRSQAYLGAEMCYIQLHALNENGAIVRFRELLTLDSDKAYAWLASCRRLLCGPVFYSLSAIHSVCYEDIAARSTLRTIQAEVLPRDLARVLVNALRLVRHDERVQVFDLADTIKVYDNTILARQTLMELSRAVQAGKRVPETAEDLVKYLRSVRGLEAVLLRALRIIAAVGLGALGAGLGGGLATAAAVETVEEATGGVIGRGGRAVGRSLLKVAGKRHLALLLQLDDDAKRRFQHT